MNRDKSWYTMQSTIMKTLEYPMEAISLNNKDWNNIMTPILVNTLPKSGINQNFPTTIVYGSKAFLGLGIMNPWHKQFILQCSTLIDQVNTRQKYTRNTITGDLIKDTIQNIRLEVGTQGGLNGIPLQILSSCMTESWIKQLVQYATSHDIQIINDLQKLSPY